jgi:hypothetical protein
MDGDLEHSTLDIMMMLQPCIPSFKLGGQRRNNTEHGMVGDG